eukprot:TRINITY_DN774342_c0_g1_i1.p1 TRINITY_DN774342_c0_g1~~TRINITY_DN774342_c0_g1_i1.p1  ORF type:complete len:162 (-),score=43.25 TRINITY_DN774342_c0_g1_i1:189-620(-)
MDINVNISNESEMEDFGSLMDLENDFQTAGEKSGSTKGHMEGFKEGEDFGNQKGYDIGIEVGECVGFIEFWEIIRTSRGLSKRQAMTLAKLQSVVKEIQESVSNDEKFFELLEQMRVKFTLFKKQVKVNLESITGALGDVSMF